LKTSRAIAVVLILGMSLQLSACSWIFVKKKPSDYKASQDIECTGYVHPIIDAIAGAGSVATLTVFATAKGGGDGGSDWAWEIMPIGITILALSIIGSAVYPLSCIYGFDRVSECKNAEEEHEKWLKNQINIKLNKTYKKKVTRQNK